MDLKGTIDRASTTTFAYTPKFDDEDSYSVIIEDGVATLCMTSPNTANQEMTLFRHEVDVVISLLQRARKLL